MNLTPADELRLTLRERFAYGIGDFGYNFVLQITTLYLLKFLTDVADINAAWAGFIFLVSKLFTGFTDLGTGIWLDSRKKLSSRGKFRPMLLWTILPLFIFNILLFYNFDQYTYFKTILFIICFMVFGLFYSLGNASYGAMVPAITKCSQERAELAAWRQGGANTGLLLVTVGFMPITLLFESQETGYLLSAFLYTSIGLIAVFYCYLNVKEHHTIPDDRPALMLAKPSIIASLKAILQNRPLGILALTNLLTLAAFNTKLMVQVFYAQYVIGDVSMIAYMSAISMGCIYLGVLLVPMTVRCFGKLPVYLAGLAIWLSGDLLNYFYGHSTIMYILFTSLALWGSAFVNSLNWALISDAVEYGEWKCGIRNEGLVYCSFTFCRKCSAALAGLLPGLVLAWSGYVPNMLQTESTQKSIANLMFIYPACALVGAALLMLFCYPLNETRYKKIISELAERHGLTKTYRYEKKP